jgi:hypothetical protein
MEDLAKTAKNNMILGMFIGATILIAGFVPGFFIGRTHREKPKVDKYEKFKNADGLYTAHKRVKDE